MIKKFLLSSALFTLMFLGFGMSNCACFANEELSDLTFTITDLTYKKQYKEALAKADSAIAKYSNEAELYYLRGIIKDHLNSPKSAIADFNKAISINPKYDDAYFWLGAIKMDLKSPQSAYVDLCRCLDINQENSKCYSMRGLVRLELGDMKGAEADLEKANTLLDKEIKNLQKN